MVQRQVHFSRTTRLQQQQQCMKGQSLLGVCCLGGTGTNRTSFRGCQYRGADGLLGSYCFHVRDTRATKKREMELDVSRGKSATQVGPGWDVSLAPIDKTPTLACVRCREPW